jgi:hypothetical protein
MAALGRGCCRHPDWQGFQYQKRISGRVVHLGCYSIKEGHESKKAKAAARLYDAVELLLHGPYAETNSEWSAYTQADIASAVNFLEGKGINVHEAVAASRDGQGAREWIGVTTQRGSAWRTKVNCKRENGKGQIAISWPWVSSAEAAAQQADCGLLAVHGLQATTNFPASSYSQQQLEKAQERAIRNGVDAERVQSNVEAVGKVCCSDMALVIAPWNDPVTFLLLYVSLPVHAASCRGHHMPPGLVGDHWPLAEHLTAQETWWTLQAACIYN